MSQILDRKNAGGTSSVDNNFDNKNAYAKAGFSTYNIADANVNASVNNISDTRDTGETSGVATTLMIKMVMQKLVSELIILHMQIWMQII